MQKINHPKIAIIIDFGAKNKFTHHIPLIQQYSLMMERLGWDLNIFVPAYSNPIDFKNCKGNVRFNLYSLLFGPKLNEKFIISLLFMVIERIVNGKKFFWLKKIIIRFLIFKPAIEAIKMVRRAGYGNEIRIIFPTTDPLAIDMGRLLNKYLSKFNVIFCYRLVGSESRGTIATGNELNDLASICRSLNSRVRVGVETDEYRTYILQHGFESWQVFWSPWPQLSSKIMTSHGESTVSLGFFGTAKKIKGFDLLPELFKQFQYSDLKFKAFVQGTVFPWPEYLKTIEVLKHDFSDVIEFTKPILDLEEMQEYISMCDFLLLPYNPESYKINGSGLQYQAADASVPVIVTKGTGFSGEVMRFNLGYEFESLVEIPNLIRKSNSKNFSHFFKIYNEERNYANILFLN